MIFHVTVEPMDDRGWIVVECPALPGCVSQGRDEKEAMENIKEAITAWLWAQDQKAVEGLAISLERKRLKRLPAQGGSAVDRSEATLP